tara:strand:+ start:409 stop:1848 length:1440 start_codon:yes stop_codon:yes gene_type:complete
MPDHTGASVGGRMTSNHYDIVVVGGGPAGYAAALAAAGYNLNVALVEKDRLGGTCLHRGCIPAKELLETAAVNRAVKGAKDFGVISGDSTLDMTISQERKQSVVDRLFKGVQQLVSSKNIWLYDGEAQMTGDRTIAVQTKEGDDISLSAEHVILATGSKPRELPGFPIDGDLIIGSDQVLELTQLPAHAAIIGGGAIGCEFASMLTDLGTQVTILESAERLIPGADPDIAKSLQRAFKKRGIRTITNATLGGQTLLDTGVTVHLSDGTDIDVEKVIVSVGRTALSEGLGLENTTVEVDSEGCVVVDQYCRATASGVYAVGDLIATPQLAHVGFAEAMLAVQNIRDEKASSINYERTAWAIYCHPEVAYAGLTETQAHEAGLEIVVSKHRFIGNARAAIHGENEGMVKVIAERRRDGKAGRILGVHLIGPWVTEQLSQGYMAINWELEIDQISKFIQPHPTFSEVFGEAVLELAGRTLHG